jgi:fluoride exporter
VIVLLIAAGAAVGAPARYLVDRAVQTRHSSHFPFGTLLVNVLASFVLGVVAGSSLSVDAQAALGTGFCGALSTFSTFGFETYRLAGIGLRAMAVANVVVSVGGGLGAVALGWLIGQSI